MRSYRRRTARARCGRPRSRSARAVREELAELRLALARRTPEGAGPGGPRPRRPSRLRLPATGGGPGGVAGPEADDRDVAGSGMDDRGDRSQRCARRPRTASRCCSCRSRRRTRPRRRRGGARRRSSRPRERGEGPGGWRRRSEKSRRREPGEDPSETAATWSHGRRPMYRRPTRTKTNPPTSRKRAARRQQAVQAHQPDGQASATARDVGRLQEADLPSRRARSSWTARCKTGKDSPMRNVSRP